MNNETCSHCGAETHYVSPKYTRFKCGVVVWRDGTIASMDHACYRRQIAKLKSEIDTTRSTLVYIAEHGGTTDEESGLSHNGSWCAEQARCALEAVK